MKTETIKTGIIAVLFLCAAFLATCEFSRPPVVETTPLQDTIFLSQWRREKKEKLDLIASYESKLSRLQHKRDSLQTLVSVSKTSISGYRLQAKQFENRLKVAIAVVATKDITVNDSIGPILDSVLIAHVQSDAACDTTIHLLETLVANRDSSLIFQKQIETNLRDLNKEQELRTQTLTEQLNLAFKVQRKKSRQNKVLAGGILILSGITTSLLLTNSHK